MAASDLIFLAVDTGRLQIGLSYSLIPSLNHRILKPGGADISGCCCPTWEKKTSLDGGIETFV